MPFAVMMNLEIVTLSEVSQTVKEKCPMLSLKYGILKEIYELTHLQNGNRLTDLKNKFMVASRGRNN